MISYVNELHLNVVLSDCICSKLYLLVFISESYIFTMNELFPHTLLDLIPVSYTHLDVYKRQHKTTLI